MKARRTFKKLTDTEKSMVRALILGSMMDKDAYTSHDISKALNVKLTSLSMIKANMTRYLS